MLRETPAYPLFRGQSASASPEAVTANTLQQIGQLCIEVDYLGVWQARKMPGLTIGHQDLPFQENGLKQTDPVEGLAFKN